MTTSRIIKAAANGQIEKVRAALSNRADIEETDANGSTALLLACFEGYTDIVRLLLENRANANHANRHGSTPLTVVCHIGSTEILRLLLDPTLGVDINHTTTGIIKGTGLIFAARNNKTEIIRLLLTLRKENLLLDKQDSAGKTALIHACQRGMTESVRLLLNANAAVDVVDSEGYTALLHACAHEHTDIALLLLEASANANHANKYGTTPLTWTCEKGNTEILRMLLEPRHNLDVNHSITTGIKGTGLIIAAKLRKTEIIQLLLALRKEDLLINKKDIHEKTALTYAWECYMTDSIHLLLGHLIEKINDETLTNKYNKGQHELTTNQTAIDIIAKIFNEKHEADQTDNLLELLDFVLSSLSRLTSRKDARLFLTQTIEHHFNAIIASNDLDELQSGKEKISLLCKTIRIIQKHKDDTHEKTAKVKMLGFIKAIEDKQASLKSTDSLIDAVNYLAKSKNHSDNDTVTYLLETTLTPESKASLVTALKTLNPTEFNQLKRRLKDAIPAVGPGKPMFHQQVKLKTLFEAREALKQNTQLPTAANDPCNNNAFLFILRTGRSHYEQKDTGSFTDMKNKIMGAPLTGALGMMGAFARRFTQASTSLDNKPFTDGLYPL